MTQQEYNSRVINAVADLHKTLAYARKLNITVDCEEINEMAQMEAGLHKVEATSITDVYYGFTAI